MSPNEINKELSKDYKYINRKKIDHIAEEYNKARKKRKISKQRMYIRIYEIQTHSKNNWILILSKAPSASSYKGVDTLTVAYICYYYAKIGIRVFKVIPTGGLSVFNSHFFTRYNERLNLGLVEPLEKVKHYFTHNSYSHSKAIPKDGRMYLVGTVRDGYILGEVQNSVWAVFKTFISKDMANEDQEELKKVLDESLLSQLEELLNTEEFDRNVYEYKADAMAALQK